MPGRAAGAYRDSRAEITAKAFETRRNEARMPGAAVDLLHRRQRH